MTSRLRGIKLGFVCVFFARASRWSPFVKTWILMCGNWAIEMTFEKFQGREKIRLVLPRKSAEIEMKKLLNYRLCERWPRIINYLSSKITTYRRNSMGNESFSFSFLVFVFSLRLGSSWLLKSIRIFETWLLSWSVCSIGKVKTKLSNGN